jgi:hypothetical protein
MLKLRGADPIFSVGLLPNRIGLYIRLGIPASGSLPVLHANYFDQVLIKGLNTNYLNT